MDSESRYYMRRARDEARRAELAETPEAAAAHNALSVRYSAKALMLRAAEDDQSRSAFPQIRSRSTAAAEPPADGA